MLANCCMPRYALARCIGKASNAARFFDLESHSQPSAGDGKASLGDNRSPQRFDFQIFPCPPSLRNIADTKIFASLPPHSLLPAGTHLVVLNRVRVFILRSSSTSSSTLFVAGVHNIFVFHLSVFFFVRKLALLLSKSQPRLDCISTNQNLSR